MDDGQNSQKTHGIGHGQDSLFTVSDDRDVPPKARIQHFELMHKIQSMFGQIDLPLGLIPVQSDVHLINVDANNKTVKSKDFVHVPPAPASW